MQDVGTEDGRPVEVCHIFEFTSSLPGAPSSPLTSETLSHPWEEPGPVPRFPRVPLPPSAPHPPAPPPPCSRSKCCCVRCGRHTGPASMWRHSLCVQGGTLRVTRKPHVEPSSPDSRTRRRLSVETKGSDVFDEGGPVRSCDLRCRGGCWAPDSPVGSWIRSHGNHVLSKGGTHQRGQLKKFTCS